MGKSFVLLAALIAGVLAGAPAHAIANGEAVPDGRYPFAVKIASLGIPTADGGTRDSSCTGGLVSPSWVITAAHCFRDVNDNRVARTVAEQTVATVGRTDLTGEGGFAADVVEVRQHGEADVALVRLDKPVTGIAPLRLGGKAPAEGQKARLVGYGFIRPDDERTPDRLRTGRFEVTSVAATEMGLSGIAPRRNTSPCERDSGGPYFTEGADGTATLIGVVSRGPACPHTGPDIATRADVVAKWVRSVIGDDVAPPPSSAAPGSAGSRTSDALDSAAEAAGPRTSAAGLIAPIALAGIPAVAVGFVALLVTGSRRRRRAGHRRRR
ncbi:trypsin-like serine protease [Actinoplanes sp. NEAU-A12]|uniref:Trypsin-like serine protease n=1 Tax=Actinoplanes sandaracinus TaxID=3045177 RepID=A0ABT6WKQ8_9ACTN|nr:trypsin-like serine protease [Actinoplanes sandaracinus]MDI6100322.1 trypsin-like serine protease [Actinoplanes sandaracinus]